MSRSLKKKIIIACSFLALFIVVGFGLRITAYLTHPSFAYQAIFNYKDTNITQTFEVDLFREGTYLIGLYTGQNYWLNKEPNDGNYTIEYFHDGHLIRTYQVEKWSQWLHRESDTPPREVWNSVEAIAFEELTIPRDMPFKKFTVKITTHKPYSFFLKGDNAAEKEITFFLMRRSEADLRKQVSIEKSLGKLLKDTKSIGFADITERYDTNASKLPLLNALLDKDYDTVKAIIEADNGIGVNTELGARKKYRLSNGRTPIFYSSHANDVKTLHYLIAEGADLDHRDVMRQNALALAIENGSIDAARELINAGMKISDVDYVHMYLTKEDHRQGSTRAPLVYAVSLGDYNLTKFLLENNATNRFPETVQGGGVDAYHYLYKIPNYKKMLHLLLDYNVSDFKGALPSKERLMKIYDGCIKGVYIDCGPINKNLKIEDLDYEVYFDFKHFAEKKQAIREQKFKEQKKTEKGEK